LRTLPGATPSRRRHRPREMIHIQMDSRQRATSIITPVGIVGCESRSRTLTVASRQWARWMKVAELWKRLLWWMGMIFDRYPAGEPVEDSEETAIWWVRRKVMTWNYLCTARHWSFFFWTCMHTQYADYDVCILFSLLSCFFFSFQFFPLHLAFIRPTLSLLFVSPRLPWIRLYEH